MTLKAEAYKFHLTCLSCAHRFSRIDNSYGSCPMCGKADPQVRGIVTLYSLAEEEE